MCSKQCLTNYKSYIEFAIIIIIINLLLGFFFWFYLLYMCSTSPFTSFEKFLKLWILFNFQDIFLVLSFLFSYCTLSFFSWTLNLCLFQVLIRGFKTFFSYTFLNSLCLFWFPISVCSFWPMCHIGGCGQMSGHS